MVTRLRQRKSETPEGLSLRIATARQEMKRMREFDYCVVNAQEEHDEAVNNVLCIINAEKSRVGQQPVEL